MALPIFPGSHPPSIVGADELNFCVRDGNRWTLIAINTNYISSPLQLSLSGELLYIIPHSPHLSSAIFLRTLSCLRGNMGCPASEELVTRTGFEPMLMA